MMLVFSFNGWNASYAYGGDVGEEEVEMDEATIEGEGRGVEREDGI